MNGRVWMSVCAMLVVTSMSMSAQTVRKVRTEESTVVVDRYKAEASTAKENWFITVGGGTSFYFGMDNSKLGFGKVVSPALDVAVGKWILPGIGVRLQYNGLYTRGATSEDDNIYLEMKDGKPVPVEGKEGLYYVKAPYFGLHGDVMFNMNNLIGGYKPARVWNIIPYAGIGLAHSWQFNYNKKSYAEMVKDKDKKFRTTSIAGNFGIINSFRITDLTDIVVDVHELVVADSFEHEYAAFGKSGDNVLTVTLGLNFNLKPRGWRQSTDTKHVTYKDLNTKELKVQVDSLIAERGRLETGIEEARNKTVNVTDTLTVSQKIRFTASCLIVFPLGVSHLQEDAKYKIETFAKTVSGTGEKLLLTGYADASTGTAEINERLSRERSQAVSNYLVNVCGISKDRIRVEFKGGVDNMFYDDPALSRSVIITIEEE